RLGTNGYRLGTAGLQLGTAGYPPEPCLNGAGIHRIRQCAHRNPLRCLCVCEMGDDDDGDPSLHRNHRCRHQYVSFSLRMEISRSDVEDIHRCILSTQHADVSYSSENRNHHVEQPRVLQCTQVSEGGSVSLCSQ
ncbi:hypothetical protein PFISCL1PPCAC_1471, partial [Pristionchus fissidentatus]